MDQKELLKYALIAVGAYLIYEYIQAQGGLTAVLSGTTGTGTSSTNICGSTVGRAASSVSTVQQELTAKNVPLSSTQISQACAGALWANVLTPAQELVFLASPNPDNPVQSGSSGTSSASTTTTTQTPPPQTSPVICPSGQTLQNGACIPIPCPTGQTQVNGVCTVEPASPKQVSQQVLQAATASGEPNSLSMDQWNYYYSIVTGQPSPVDAGSVPAGVYTGAGVSMPDGSLPGDPQVLRTVPTDVGTWLAIMQNQDPSAGLTGMGLFSIRHTPAWLM